MDTSTHFFSDCLDFEDSNPYQSPEQDQECGTITLQPFNPYATKLDILPSPSPADGRELEPRTDLWDGFSEQLGPMMAPADQKPLFVDPGLYSPESEEEETKAQIQVIPITVSRASTRRTSASKYSRRTSKSGSTSTSITPPEAAEIVLPEPPKRRKVRKTRKEPSVTEDLQKRSKFLERNRIAASKCREKKKQYVSELEGTKVGLEAHHLQLQAEYNTLLGEISGLKHHLMAHAKCNDPNIDRWLNNEARKFVETTDELYPPFINPFAPPGTVITQPTPGVPGSPASRNPSIASSYPSLPSVQFDGLGSADRQGSIAYSHGTAPSLYTSPTDETFPCLPPTLKREPSTNYDHMPDSMFRREKSTFGGD